MRLKRIVLSVFAACAGCLGAVESEAFRIENRTSRDGAVVTGKGAFSTKSIFLPAAGFGFSVRPLRGFAK